WLFCLAIVNLLAIANVVREIRRRRDRAAFLSSCIAVIMLLAICAIGMYPNLVLSAPNPEHSLTIRNAASSQKTLGVMLTIALIGMPLVIGYTSSIYYIFRGKVKLDRASY
ncbi:MAG: cytochrome d ubiquinol oxidase subunit II, partial [Verrucomicrobiia bacterium]